MANTTVCHCVHWFVDTTACILTCKRALTHHAWRHDWNPYQTVQMLLLRPLDWEKNRRCLQWVGSLLHAWQKNKISGVRASPQASHNMINWLDNKFATYQPRLVWRFQHNLNDGRRRIWLQYRTASDLGSYITQSHRGASRSHSHVFQHLFNEAPSRVTISSSVGRAKGIRSSWDVPWLGVERDENLHSEFLVGDSVYQRECNQLSIATRERCHEPA